MPGREVEARPVANKMVRAEVFEPSTSRSVDNSLLRHFPVGLFPFRVCEASSRYVLAGQSSLGYYATRVQLAPSLIHLAGPQL